jgi:hypothetical protein
VVPNPYFDQGKESSQQRQRRREGEGGIKQILLMLL